MKNILNHIYNGTKQRIWKIIGIKMYKERSAYIARLLNELDKEFRFSALDYPERFLIDIGCGIGNLTKECSVIFDTKAIGVDLEKWFALDGKAFFIIADSCSLPFKQKSCLFVTAFSLIEHLHPNSRNGFFQEVHRVMADSGIFVIQLPNRYFPIEQHSFLPFVGYLPSRLHNMFYYSFVSVPSKKETVKELTKNRFRIISIVEYGIPFLGFSPKNLSSKILPFGFIIVVKKRL